MADANHSELPTRVALSVIRTWRRLDFEQRLAAVGALLLIVSTFGPFSFVEGAILLTAVAVLVLLWARASGRDFHVPFGDGAMIAVAGAWSALLILFRLFNRPLGQGLLALVCAAILIVAGVRERTERPADDHREPRPGAPPASATPAAEEAGPGAATPAPARAAVPDGEESPHPSDALSASASAERAGPEDETTEQTHDAAEAETIEVRDPILADDDTEPIVTRSDEQSARPDVPSADDLGEPPEFVPPARTARRGRRR